METIRDIQILYFPALVIIHGRKIIKREKSRNMVKVTLTLQ